MSDIVVQCCLSGTGDALRYGSSRGNYSVPIPIGIPMSEFEVRGISNAREGFGVGQEVVESLGATWPTADIGMKAKSHDPGVGLAFVVQPVEFSPPSCTHRRRCVVLPGCEPCRNRGANQRCIAVEPTRNLDEGTMPWTFLKIRRIFITVRGVVEESIFANEVEGDATRETCSKTDRPGPVELVKERQHPPEHYVFLVAVHLIKVFVVDRVGSYLVAALCDFAAGVRIGAQQGRTDEERGIDLMLLEHIQHSPNTDPAAKLALVVIPVVGRPVVWLGVQL